MIRVYGPQKKRDEAERAKKETRFFVDSDKLSSFNVTVISGAKRAPGDGWSSSDLLPINTKKL